MKNDSDPDGDDFDFAGIRGVTPTGAKARVEQNVLIYTPAADSADSAGEVDYALREIGREHV